MAVLLFRLNDVPPDEADEVRELLTANAIDCYETSAGRWGISVAAIWLRDEAQLGEARRLIDTYQEERSRRMREAYAALQQAGEAETLLDRLKREPLRTLLYALIIAAILYLSMAPFLR